MLVAVSYFPKARTRSLESKPRPMKMEADSEREMKGDGHDIAGGNMWFETLSL
jgi:hypothetical protein